MDRSAGEQSFDLARSVSFSIFSGGKRTLRLLARTLRIPKFGAIKALMKSHYDQLGFNPAFANILVEASEVV